MFLAGILRVIRCKFAHFCAKKKCNTSLVLSVFVLHFNCLKSNQWPDFQYFRFCGVTGNRTRDTRIFSPLLYQLSYDTVF